MYLIIICIAFAVVAWAVFHGAAKADQEKTFEQWTREQMIKHLDDEIKRVK
jgi:hypothetical protein